MGMTPLPLIPAAADHGRLECGYFERGECRSCALIETEYPQQITDEEVWCHEILAAVAPSVWLPSFTSGIRDFRHRAMLVVGGAAGHVSLGILDQECHVVALRECAFQASAILTVIPVLAGCL